MDEGIEWLLRKRKLFADALYSFALNETEQLGEAIGLELNDAETLAWLQRELEDTDRHLEELCQAANASSCAGLTASIAHSAGM